MKLKLVHFLEKYERDLPELMEKMEKMEETIKEFESEKANLKEDNNHLKVI